MGTFAHIIGGERYVFRDLKDLLAKASPLRSGDQLAGVAAAGDAERAAAQIALADVPLSVFLEEQIVPYETDEVTRLIIDTHNRAAFKTVSHLTVGGFRDWLLSDHASTDSLTKLSPGRTPEMVADVVSHLRDGAFLGTFGVSSISAEDTIHYELNDPDWSGGGAYIGEGPILAQTLYEIGKPELAWDVLQRLLWMGQYLPYFPQECYCDKAAVVAHKRANEVSGLAGLQAIVFGMAGFEPRMDGSLWLHPHPPKTGKVTLSGYPFQGHRIDLDMAADYCRISVDEVVVHEGRPRRLKVLPK